VINYFKLGTQNILYLTDLPYDGKANHFCFKNDLVLSYSGAGLPSNQIIIYNWKKENIVKSLNFEDCSSYRYYRESPRWSNDGNFFCAVGISRKDKDKIERSSVYIYSKNGELKNKYTGSKDILNAEIHIY